MQQSAPNTMQKPQQTGGICPVCKGLKVVEARFGQKLTCHNCRGTGKATGTISTK